MNRTLGWILVTAGAVLVGIGVAVGLDLFRGGDVHPPTHPNTLAAAAAPPTVPVPAPTATAGDVPIAVAPTEEEPNAASVLQPHEEREATAESEGIVPASDAAAEVGPPEPVVITVWELASAGAEYAGREVVLTGRILTLCIRGCQLSLDDGTGVMAVELVDDALTNTVPLRSMGRQIEITGVFRLAPRPHVSVERPDGWRFP